jgi:uncharacterized OB-fold protein
MSKDIEQPTPTTRKWSSPKVNPETRGFWEATAQGKFMLGRCRACGEAHYYPRSICPFCHSDDTFLEESSGEGDIYTFSIMRKSPHGPYGIGYVKMKEGPCVLTNFIDCDLLKLHIGAKVRVTFQQTDGPYSIPLFTMT